ncbi:hypothetical protein N7462_009169 [Penicillium macrosclerotiorum]|uniref:uncharacterized protein n=1 Tax=Penicillium macrosclerotiorum TaxID=303699 RepID=UPI002546701E|nr:uncharacterized protein N7462_009169 [Penicillium macrosclerotiorum]KAJ5673730.1 hypothetical protein N7462_009169 [Penicillium macrosclerotiorum]
MTQFVWSLQTKNQLDPSADVAINAKQSFTGLARPLQSVAAATCRGWQMSEGSGQVLSPLYPSCPVEEWGTGSSNDWLPLHGQAVYFGGSWPQWPPPGYLAESESGERWRNRSRSQGQASRSRDPLTETPENLSCTALPLPRRKLGKSPGSKEMADAQLCELLAACEEVTDVEEEAFLLFSQDIPTTNLGFVDSRANSVDVTIHGAEYTIHQSPSLLSSSRAGGTTGAAELTTPGQSFGKSPPLFADWISSPSNPLWTHSILSPTSVVTELGCGISALVALALSPSVQHYIATDQEYVRRVFRANLDENASAKSSSSTKQKSSKARASSSKSAKKQQSVPPAVSNVTFTTLDWELDQPERLKDCIESESSTVGHGAKRQEEEDDDRGFDLLLSCDCIYNEALVAPFVRTCAEVCRLRPAYEPSENGAVKYSRRPTVSIIAQQQRSPDVFEAWLRETLREFRIWRLSDEVLGNGLKSGTGYLVHLLMVREKN